MSADGLKRAVGEAAALRVHDGMAVGLGTGSTAVFFIAGLGRRMAQEGLRLRAAVATSRASEALATEAGIDLTDLSEVGRIDLTIDGADEVGPGLALIKGGGAALTREKLVWEASDRCLVIADSSKRVARLGAFALPVEVVAFGHATTAQRLRAAAAHAGAPAEPRLRLRDGAPLVTDNGGLIYDMPCSEIPDPVGLAQALKGLTGVVEHGLFPGLADEALIGTDGGVVSLSRDG